MVDIRRKLHEVSRRYAWGSFRDLICPQRKNLVLNGLLAGDVESINWGELKDDLRTPAEHCQYKYLAQVEGFAYSGRLKSVPCHKPESLSWGIAPGSPPILTCRYLLQCRSVTVAHPMTFTQHFHPL